VSTFLVPIPLQYFSSQHSSGSHGALRLRDFALEFWKEGTFLAGDDTSHFLRRITRLLGELRTERAIWDLSVSSIGHAVDPGAEQWSAVVSQPRGSARACVRSGGERAPDRGCGSIRI
jgi:hypothetical protein